MERLNRARKRFNTAIGFVKLDDPRPRLLGETYDAVDSVDGPKARIGLTPGHDRYKRMKQFASFLQFLG